jgi:DNA-binding CsgD family transcriptional regulator
MTLAGSTTLQRSWNDCVDRLYDAVGREHTLARALGDFMPFFEARGVTFLTIPDVRHPMSSHTGSVGVSEQSLLEYHSHFNVHDEWVLAAQRRSDFREGLVCSGSELVPRTRLRQSYFWKAFLSRHAVMDIVTAMVEMSPAAGPASFITFHRHDGQRPFARRDVQTLARLVPHLRHVLRLHRRLAPALAVGSTLLEVVQRIDTPVLFLAADGRIVQHNAAAGTALKARPGWLRQQSGGLGLATAQGWQTVDEALARLRADPQAHLALDLVSEDRRCASLGLMSVHGAISDHIAQHPAVAVATLKPGPRDVATALRTLHGLTPAEARTALLLVGGKTAADICTQTGQSMATVRSHIAAALGKLGLQRQAQLVARVMAL